ncbi:hypothetical protein NW766_000926 [Fusarium irregulare]|uniref:Uncharacterized protein n=1 Tax=Fusarium irregulare TaxID=2494466 RepID=A0A9W8Q2V3_9HYPO|nr:hypothetical protein NW766_000926 [Fusarium irregulare]
MFGPRKQLSSYVFLIVLVRMSICIPESEFLYSIYEPWLRDASSPGFNPRPSIGGANHTRCCMQAVSEALMMENGTIRIRPDQTFLHGNLSMLEEFPQFPCVAKLNDSASLKGPTQFLWTPYDWCTEKCPGWAGIPFHAYDSWVKPLISFILPSLVFALNVPRRRKVSLAKRFFPIEALSFGRLFFFALKVPLTMLIITLDLLVWLSVLFAIAGPVLMSGMYEAYLDAQILDYLSKRMQSNTLSIQQRAHLLLVILIGNLDYTPAWDHSVQFVRVLPTDAPRRRFSQYRDRHTSRTSAAGSHLAPDDTSPSPLTRSSNDNTLVTPMVAMTTDPNSLYNEEERARIKTVQVKLSAMLDSQVKFGSTVGAPILFYISSFIYSVFDVESNIGEQWVYK